MAVAELEHETLLTEKPVGWFTIIWRRLRRHKLAMISVGVILFLVTVAVTADFIAPFDPLAPDPANKNAPPSFSPVRLFGMGPELTTELDNVVFLFGVGPELAGDLDSGILSAALRDAFKQSKITLSPQATLVVEEAGTSWVVVDSVKTYTIEREDAVLNVYSNAVSTVLREAFKANGRTLGSTAHVEILESGSKWLVADAGSKYTIQREDGQALAVFAPAHWMGTDEIGRDIFSRLIKAAQISLTVAFVVTAVSQVAGAIIGAVSGFYGRWVDAIIQRVTEFLITLPLLPLLLAFSAILKGMEIPWLPREWSSAVIIIFVLTAFGWMGACRLVRGMVLSLRDREFVEASKALGMGDLRIILKHMIPNALPPLIVNATLDLGGIIILEAALSFLGLGIQPPMPTWGNMLNAYQRNMWQYPIQVFFPGLAIFITTLAFNYFGDGMRDALDPRLKL